MSQLGHSKSQCYLLPCDNKPNIPQKKKLEGNVAVICPDYRSENVENYLPLNTELQSATADASGVNRDGKLSFEIATVCGKKCKMLRDTGFNTVAVNGSLIPKESLTGRSVNVRTFCCANRTFAIRLFYRPCRSMCT